MDVTEFNKNYLNILLDKISKEKTNVFLLGYFDIHLRKYNVHKPTNNFLDILASSNLIPYILQPAQHSKISRTLTDNIYLELNVASNKIRQLNYYYFRSLIIISYGP